ncbi:MAG: Kae1-associated kinase Bud32 [Thermoprotei archaeon]
MDEITLETTKKQLIKRGAESEIWLGVWLDLPAIFKVRISKPYRHTMLDKIIREHRTISEAKIMAEALEIGINVPIIYDIDLDEMTIVMEYIEGSTLKSILEINPSEGIKWAYVLGTIIGKLHRNNIMHGDLTTSNVIVRNDRLYLIDFGLAEKTNRLEDHGLDLHLLNRILDSNHHKIATLFLNEVLKGYSDVVGSEKTKLIKEKMREIKLRGRYIHERKLKNELQ